MGKIFKEKAKRSLPVLVIICLLNLFTMGVSFNLNFDFLNFSSGKFFTSPYGAEAADTASTTVTVRNAPPSITAGPTENPTSTSTTPINLGGSIGFEATATDGENNSYWLVICSSGEATSTVGADPYCAGGGTTFCTSTLTANTVQASCTYNNVADPGSEIQAWYAFVCDNHATDPQCSATGMQGSGVGGSPFYVNHPPLLTRVYTSVDNQDPGAVFTIYASSTDSDVTGGADEMELYICSSNSWTILGCADTTFCTGSSTSPDVTCNYDDTEPTPHGAYTYYAYLKDWHNLAASSENGTSSQYNVNNVAPQISNVTLNGGANISLNIKNATEKDVLVSSVSVTDNNGCTDMVSATSTAYLGSLSDGADCSANDNNCYQIGASDCVLSSCDGVDDATAAYTCSTTFAFHAVPTDADAAAAATSWFARLAANDGDTQGTGSYTTLDGVEVVSTAALEVTETEIVYGTVQASGNTGADNASTTVVNFGNTPIDSDLDGQDMTKTPDIIGIENQKFSAAEFDWTVGGTVMSSSTAQEAGLSIARPTSQVDVSDMVYWGIGVPAGTPSGDYEGYNTFTVVEDLAGNWN